MGSPRTIHDFAEVYQDSEDRTNGRRKLKNSWLELSEIVDNYMEWKLVSFAEGDRNENRDIHDISERKARLSPLRAQGIYRTRGGVTAVTRGWNSEISRLEFQPRGRVPTARPLMPTIDPTLCNYFQYRFLIFSIPLGF